MGGFAEEAGVVGGQAIDQARQKIAATRIRSVALHGGQIRINGGKAVPAGLLPEPRGDHFFLAILDVDAGRVVDEALDPAKGLGLQTRGRVGGVAFGRDARTGRQGHAWFRFS